MLLAMACHAHKKLSSEATSCADYASLVRTVLRLYEAKPQ